MVRPIKIEPLPHYILRLTYSDGVEGTIDLSREVGQGVFALLKNEAFFRTAYIGQFGKIAWSDDLEICPDAAYEEITGKQASAVPARG